MRKIIKKMNILLDGKQKAKMGGIVVLMIIGALLEACSIGLVIPVITTLLDPAAVTGDGYLGDIYRFLGMESTGQFTIIMLLAIIAAFVLKNIFLYSHPTYITVCTAGRIVPCSRSCPQERCS